MEGIKVPAGKRKGPSRRPEAGGVARPLRARLPGNMSRGRAKGGDGMKAPAGGTEAAVRKKEWG
jgi:hypothetical protein